jgi:aspartate/methionine/tyrosine aminotransferase
LSNLDKKFAKLGLDNAPGQEVRQQMDVPDLQGPELGGTPVDFSHGDVNAFPPIPGSLQTFIEGFEEGAEQAYTEYRGRQLLRESLAQKLAKFSGAEIDSERELILTPGTQGALFLAVGASMSNGDKVAIVEPDYFANRKLVEFFEGEVVPVQMDYLGTGDGSGLDLTQLEESFQSGVKLFIFSNPNNPTGVIYSHDEVVEIANLAERYGATVIVDQLYSRQIFDERHYTHLRGLASVNRDNVITIIGPSKTESLSGFRLGVAIGPSTMINRMEKLQAIVSLRAAGYCQAVLRNWFSEPENWMSTRVAQHQAIRDDIFAVLDTAEGFVSRLPEGGSYFFPTIPPIRLDIGTFSKALRLQAGVSVTPGTEFGPGFSSSFRINFSQSHEAAVAAMQRTVELVDRYRLPSSSILKSARG